MIKAVGLNFAVAVVLKVVTSSVDLVVVGINVFAGPEEV
jgi:hypothetical protein